MKYTPFILIGVLLLMSSCSEENKFQPLENDEPMFMAIGRNDPEMNQAFDEAKENLDLFNTLILKPEHTNSFKSIKIRILDQEFSEEQGEEEYAYLWVSNIQRDEDDYLGYIFELPEGGISDLKPETWIKFDESYIYDWMIQNQQGQLWGGYTVRVMREKQPPNQRANFDEYQGITEYK